MDEEPCGLTMVAFMKQLGTGWEEDVREFRDLPDHVYCSQNSLQRSGAQRGRGSARMESPTSIMWQTGQFVQEQEPRTCCLTFLRT